MSRKKILAGCMVAALGLTQFAAPPRAEAISIVMPTSSEPVAIAASWAMLVAYITGTTLIAYNVLVDQGLIRPMIRA